MSSSIDRDFGLGNAKKHFGTCGLTLYIQMATSGIWLAQSAKTCTAPAALTEPNPTVHQMKQLLRNEIAFARCKITQIRRDHETAVFHASQLLSDRVLAERDYVDARRATFERLSVGLAASEAEFAASVDAIGKKTFTVSTFASLDADHATLSQVAMEYLGETAVSPLFVDYGAPALEISASLMGAFDDLSSRSGSSGRPKVTAKRSLTKPVSR